MGISSEKTASEAGDDPTKPSNKGKREAEDIIRNDNRKKRKKRKKHKKKALVEENDGGAKTTKTFIKEKDDDYMDKQDLKACDAPTKPSNKGKREAEDIIRNDNQKKRKKRKKKALVEENDGGANTGKTVIKEKDDNYMDKQELKEDSYVVITDQVKLSAEINPMDSNPRLGDESSGVMKDASAPKETPAIGNGHRDESENDNSKEVIDDGESKTKKFKVSPSGTFIPEESNSKASKEDGGGKEESYEEEPLKMQEVEESVNVPVENNSSEEISSEEDMAASSDEEETEMDAAPKDQQSGSKTLYVGNLSFSAEQADIRHFFKAAGEIVDARLAMRSDISCKCFGHVEFTTTEGAMKALKELNGKVLVDRPVNLQLAKEKEVRSFQKGGKAPRQTIFVCGFNKDDGEDQIRSALQDHFGSCGDITRVSIPKANEGGVRGIAYIDFKDFDAYNQALEFNGSVFHNNILTVEAANPRDDGFDSGSRGGWRGGRGSGGRFSGHLHGGRTGRGLFSGGGQGGRGRAAPRGS